MNSGLKMYKNKSLFHILPNIICDHYLEKLKALK